MSLAGNFTEKAEQLVREHHLAHEAFTEKQLAEAIRQALAAGDFQRFVVRGSGAQQVVYLPFQMVEQLRARVNELSQAGDELVKAQAELEKHMTVLQAVERELTEALNDQNGNLYGKDGALDLVRSLL